MSTTRSEILAKLQKDILTLQGFRPLRGVSPVSPLPQPVNEAFPNREFPFGAIHEFFCHTMEDAAATQGFIGAIAAALPQKKGTIIWISASGNLFPPAMASFGIAAENIIFIRLQKNKEMLWAMEEALKCRAVTTVAAEINDLDFTASRRLQLAVEQSRVTGFIMRTTPRKKSITACTAQWKITHLPGIPEEELPGMGHPCWNVELLKIRNGKPGTWQLAWNAGRIVIAGRNYVLQADQTRKTG